MAKLRQPTFQEIDCRRDVEKMSHKREWNLGPGSLFDCCGDLPSSSLVPPIWNPKSPGPPPPVTGAFSYPAVAALAVLIDMLVLL